MRITLFNNNNRGANGNTIEKRRTNPTKTLVLIKRYDQLDEKRHAAVLASLRGDYNM